MANYTFYTNFQVKYNDEVCLLSNKINHHVYLIFCFSTPYFYEIYLEDQQRVKGIGRKYKFRTRVEYPTWTNRGIEYTGYESRISEWRVADCFKSTIDGKLVRALPRSGAERGEAELIRAICGLGPL